VFQSIVSIPNVYVSVLPDVGKILVTLAVPKPVNDKTKSFTSILPEPEAVL